MPLRLHISGRFHPACSLLGRFVRRRHPDPLEGESLYIVAAVSIGAGLLLAETVIWTILAPASVGLYAAVGSQAGAALIFVLTCVIGWQPRIELVLDEACMEITSAAGRHRIPLRSITRTSRIDATRYYRHYRRYERTLSFVNRIPEQLLLLETSERPVVLGISVPDQLLFEKELAKVSDWHHVA